MRLVSRKGTNLLPAFPEIGAALRDLRDLAVETLQKIGLEGVVAKRAASPHRRGRSSDWIKIKTETGLAIDEERKN